MRKLTLLTVLVLTVFSTPVFAKWTEVDENVDGDTFYVDFERIRKHSGFVYWWELGDYLKPIKHGDLSAKVYNQGDCNLSRIKVLTYSVHKEPMGRGTPSASSNTPDKDWTYPRPNSTFEVVLKKVCGYTK